MKQTDKVALGGVLGALSLVCMLLTIIPTATYALPAIAGVVLMPLVVEWGARFGFTVFAAVGVLALIMSPDKEAALLFVAFFGHYPIVKALLEKHIRQRPIRWVLKFTVFNACVIAAYALLVWLFAFPMDEFELFGISAMWLILLCGNVVFWLYDIALKRVITMYVCRLRTHLMRIVRK